MSAVRSWDWFGDGSVVLTDIALACCGLEIEAAVPTAAREINLDEITSDARRIVTVSGTVTNAVAHDVAALIATLDAGEKPAVVVSFGACVAAGGPYWDSYSVLKGLDQLVRVDRFVPGCPPPPAAIAAVCEDVRRG